MTTFAKAPLLEVILEVRWGAEGKQSDEPRLKYDVNDTQMFAGQFKKAAEEAGYHIHEALENVPALPFLVAHRFHRTGKRYPLLQIGLGIFSFNQINEGYDWDTFQPAALQALKILDDGHPSGIGGLRSPGIELRYVDGLEFDEDESPLEFMNRRLMLDFNLPNALKSDPSIGEEVDSKLVFGLNTQEPTGQLLLELDVGTINARPGLIVSTRVRSARDDMPDRSQEALSDWLAKAHRIQMHAFRTLIEPAYLKEMRNGE